MNSGVGGAGRVRAVAYYRVSTAAQGRSGLGLDAQRLAVAQFCQGRAAQLMSEFTEIESGKNNARPELTKALHYAKVTGAGLLKWSDLRYGYMPS
jgi:DNA invertase Pin-like site-specific DNA recombinase